MYGPAITVSAPGAQGQLATPTSTGNAGDGENGRDILATAFLQAGQAADSVHLPFSFEITEGEDRYVVSVSRRGE